MPPCLNRDSAIERRKNEKKRGGERGKTKMKKKNKNKRKQTKKMEKQEKKEEDLHISLILTQRAKNCENRETRNDVKSGKNRQKEKNHDEHREGSDEDRWTPK